MTQHNIVVPAGAPADYVAAHRGAATLDRSDRGRLLVTGVDRATYLHGLLTNDITSLEAGEGCYAAYLTPQGRMIADMWVYELGDALLLSMDGTTKRTVLEKLEDNIFAEDVKLEDVTERFAQIAIVGPGADRVLAMSVEISSELLQGLAAHANARMKFNGRRGTIARILDAGIDGFDVYVDRDLAPILQSTVASHGAARLDPQTADVIRIEAGVPLFHRDMDEETIPLEAGLESRAISFTKGCYVGQEVIVRVLHRGHGRVARRLVGLRFEAGSAVSEGAVVRSDDREVGRVTSATFSFAIECPVALAYVLRDFVEPGTRVTVGDATGEVVPLPFRSFSAGDGDRSVSR